MSRVLPMLCAALLFPTTLIAQPEDATLFESLETLELLMPVDFEALCRPSVDSTCDFVPVPLQYRDHAGQWRELSVEIRRRDGWRAQFTNCQVPTLFVRFPPEQAAGTPFQGQTILAMTSHCGKGVPVGEGRSLELPSDFEPYVINEYLGHRLYNMMTEVSLRVRLARVRYVNPANSRSQSIRDAFFAEHFDALAERTGAVVLPPDSFDPKRLDTEAAGRLALFQYMIGNTDWSIQQQENVLLLGQEDGRQVPVPYDLDQSGLVNAHYAQPGPGLPIDTVRQRYFLGFCHSDAEWEALFGQYIGGEADMKKALAAVPGLRRGDRRMAGVYLDEFFDLLVRVDQRTQAIVDVCQAWPPDGGAGAAYSITQAH